MGQKYEAPPAPDYGPVAAADAKSAEMAFQLGQEQLDWSKEQYRAIEPYVLDYLETQTRTTEQAQQFAEDQMAAYREQYAPVEREFVERALNYNSPARAQMLSAAAMADVGTAIDAQRQNALTNLQSYGLDPSQTKYGALDAGYRIAKATAQAAAGTQSRLNTEATELALLGEAINIGRGYPGAIATSYGTATQAGAAGTKAADTHYATGASSMGTPVSYFGQGNTALGNWGNALNMGYSNELAGAKLTADVNASQAAGIGNIAGKLVGAAIPIISDRRFKRGVELIGFVGRLPWYAFNYLSDAVGVPKHQGFMADEVRQIIPEAVVMLNGVEHVDYPLAIAGAMR